MQIRHGRGGQQGHLEHDHVLPSIKIKLQLPWLLPLHLTLETKIHWAWGQEP